MTQRITHHLKLRGLLVSLAMMLCCAVAGPEKPVSEYQIKAVFLYNFTKFIEWPEGSIQSKAPFVIGVLGDDPFGPVLDEIVRSEKVHGRPLVVKRLKTPDDVGSCQILFVTRSERESFASLVQQIGQRPILTVCDFENENAHASMIHLAVVENNVRMEVNLRRAEKSGLHISSRLLGLAKIVEESER